MPRDCSAIQEDLARYAGHVDRLEGVDRNHVEHCPGCEKVVHEEMTLAQALSELVPADDKNLQSRIVASLRKARLHRRVLGLLPVAASLIISLAGITLLGSIPGSSLVAQFPRWSSSSYISLASAVTDWQIALSLVAASAAEAIPVSLLIIAAFVSAGGLATVVTLLHRWKKKASWQE